MNLTPNFKLSEFLSKNDKGKRPDYITIMNLKILANRLQVIRDLTGRQIRINSGYRSPEYNASIGGAKNSYHVQGMAADIRIDGMSPARVQAYLNGWSGGLGSYSSFTHIDIRNGKARWHG